MKKEAFKLPFSEKLGYGIGDFSSSMFYKLFSTFLMFYYTDVFGISAAAVGTMILVTRVWDAANDPIMGAIADRTNTRWGKFRPYLIWMALPFAVTGVACFTAPDLSQVGKIVYAYITYSLLMTVYTAVNVPYSSLIGVMTSDSNERTQLASYRYFFAFSGGIFVQATLLKLVSVFGGENVQAGWQRSIGLYSFIAMAVFIAAFFLVKERIKPITDQNNKLKDDLKDLLHNKQWFILLGVSVLAVIFNQLREGTAVYYFKYYIAEKDVSIFGKMIHFDFETLTGVLIPLWTASNLLGVLLASFMAKKFGKKKSFMICMLISVFASALYYPIQPDNIYHLFVLQIIVGIAAGTPLVLMLAMFGDIADYSELKTGRRATALVFSSITMSQKFGSTLGIAFTGYILAWAGYKADIVNAESQNSIRLLMSIIPAIAALLSVVVLAIYKLSDGYMKEVSEKLESKRV